MQASKQFIRSKTLHLGGRFQGSGLNELSLMGQRMTLELGEDEDIEEGIIATAEVCADLDRCEGEMNYDTWGDAERQDVM